jgi:hypothetical protein
VAGEGLGIHKSGDVTSTVETVTDKNLPKKEI